MIIKHVKAAGYQTIEATKEAEEDWQELLSGSMQMLADSSCTPGYYNNEGQPLPDNSVGYVGHPDGAMAYFKFIDGWREAGDFEGMRVS